MGGTTRSIHVALVEDHDVLRTRLTESLEQADYLVSGCATAAQGCEAIESGVDLVVLDVRLPDESGVLVAQFAFEQHPPLPVVAMSAVASAPEAFLLRELGVRHYLEKPFQPARLIALCEEVLAAPPPLSGAVRAQLGHRLLKDIKAEARNIAVSEAAAATGGNRTQMAELLGISRQAAQNAMRPPTDAEDE